jgi:hypothetical protein
MPAASAEKRARQRANKCLQAKSTAEPAVLTAQAPEIISPPAQSTDSTSVFPTSAPLLVNFETFVNLANLDDILRFCNAAASTQEGRNLKLFWDRAFEAGLDQGRTEERDFRDEMYLRGKAQGIKDAEEAASSAEIDLYRHGIEKGRTEERSEWTSVGHGPHCLIPVAALTDKNMQTDFEPPITATPEPPPLAVPPQITCSPPLVWADDAALLPTQILSSPLPTRDFSDLRSSKQNPFSSLQRRLKNRISRGCQSHRYHFNFNSSYPFHHISSNLKPFQPHSHLNWESDPRLFNLSHALRALGWIRAPQVLS